VLKTFCRFLERERFTPSNPMATVAMPKVDKRIMPAFTPDDVRALLGAWASGRGGPLHTAHLPAHLCAVVAASGNEHLSPPGHHGPCELEVLRRYLALVEADAQDAHRRFGAVDHMP
jgi:hypothetical protein